mmetsp:Transcript_14115/g.36434  ORF Transcript_14115/g.36434 Transcript_14115/m.36434 type:complete len:201 (+) Transcript_14115:450-1052(+)
MDDSAGHCHCSPIELPVCANGNSYFNPCYAFCHGAFQFEYGDCNTAAPTPPAVVDHCSAGPLSMFGQPAMARLSRTSYYRIGTRITVGSVEECAVGCLQLGDTCQSFEFHLKQKFCEFKSVTGAAGQGTWENTKWHLYERSSECSVAREGDDLNTTSVIRPFDSVEDGDGVMREGDEGNAQVRPIMTEPDAESRPLAPLV